MTRNGPRTQHHRAGDAWVSPGFIPFHRCWAFRIAGPVKVSADFKSKSCSRPRQCWDQIFPTSQLVFTALKFLRWMTQSAWGHARMECQMSERGMGAGWSSLTGRAVGAAIVLGGVGVLLLAKVAENVLTFFGV